MLRESHTTERPSPPATATFLNSSINSGGLAQSIIKSDYDHRWKVPFNERINKYYPPDFEEREDIKELKRRMIKPEFDDTFRLIERKDFILSNRKQIGTLDTLKNYHTGRGGGHHRSLQPPKRAL